eukprot:c37081_g1_i1 orf=22-357(-)
MPMSSMKMPFLVSLKEDEQPKATPRERDDGKENANITALYLHYPHFPTYNIIRHLTSSWSSPVADSSLISQRRVAPLPQNRGVVGACSGLRLLLIFQASPCATFQASGLHQ